MSNLVHITEDEYKGNDLTCMLTIGMNFLPRVGETITINGPAPKKEGLWHYCVREVQHIIPGNPVGIVAVVHVVEKKTA